MDSASFGSSILNWTVIAHNTLGVLFKDFLDVFNHTFRLYSDVLDDCGLAYLPIGSSQI